LRLARRFSYENVNDPSSTAAAANGQFLMMRRDLYDAIGGHSAVAGEVLEDVALAMRVKAAGHRISFGSGKGIVHVRMYRSFQAMWQGWKKNLYRLMGGTPWAVFREMGVEPPLDSSGRHRTGAEVSVSLFRGSFAPDCPKPLRPRSRP